MTSLREIAAWVQQIVLIEFYGWVIFLVAGIIGFGASIAGNVLFGSDVGLAIGIGSFLCVAYALGKRGPNHSTKNQQ